jgi:hypothetical protein
VTAIATSQTASTIYHDDGSETVEQLPGEWCICGHCEGHGTSSSYLGAFTSSEWAEQDDDFRRDYMRGEYDRACERCGGSGKVWGIAYDKLTPEQLHALEEERDAAAYIAAEERAERRAGC